MHVVILTHYFPPIGGPGARRMLGWVNGFAAEGHAVMVVTPEAHPRDPYYQPGETYSGDAEVLRPRVFDPARLARGSGETPVAAAEKTSEKRGLAARLRPWLLLPDQRRLANGPLVQSAADTIRDSGFPDAAGPTLVLTSSPYNSVHLAGLTLKRRLGKQITWIADFRDDWFHPVFFPFPNAVYRAYNRRLEREVLDRADGLTVVSRGTLEKIRKRHPKLPEAFWQTEREAKWRWMPNGFDRTGVAAILDETVARRDPSAPIHLLFSGTLWQGHSVDPLIAALDAVAERTGQRFRFELAGRVIEPVMPTHHPDRVEIVTGGWKPYEQSLAATRQADLLLVHTGPESQDIKIKVFDAAAVRRPALVLGPEDSATVRLVREQVAEPLIADQHDQSAIELALERYLASDDESRHAFAVLPDEYDRLKQAGRLLEWASSLGSD